MIESLHQETAISSLLWLRNEPSSFFPTVSFPGSMKHATHIKSRARSKHRI